MDGRTKAAMKSRLLKMWKAKEARDKADATYRENADQIIDRMQAEGIEKLPVELDDGSVLTGTVVTSSTLTVDMDALRDAVGDKVMEKVTKVVIDMASFRDAVSTGDIPLDVANTVVSETARAPYMKVTKK